MSCIVFLLTCQLSAVVFSHQLSDESVNLLQISIVAGSSNEVADTAIHSDHFDMIHRIIEGNCQSDDTFGYPRFASLSELQASPWADHFMDVYSELPPASDFPICTFDFWFLPNKTDLLKLGLTEDDRKSGGKPHSANKFEKGEFANGNLFSSGNLDGYLIYHDWHLYSQLQNHFWTEITHNIDGYSNDKELDAMWFFRRRGSGVWFNVGKTIAFTDQGSAYEHFFHNTETCQSIGDRMHGHQDDRPDENGLSRCARSHGFDSLQFRPWPEPVLNTFGLAGWIELFSTQLRGRYPCGADKGGISDFFRSGWKASKTCDCDSAAKWTACRRL